MPPTPPEKAETKISKSKNAFGSKAKAAFTIKDATRLEKTPARKQAIRFSLKIKIMSIIRQGVI
jgi:hypothetical protein